MKYNLVIGVLTFNRVELLKRTIESFFKNCPFAGEEDVKWILFDNGSSPEVTIENKSICKRYGIEYFSFDDQMDETYDNEMRDQQIASGHYNLLTKMNEIDSKTYMILEDDWQCIDSFDRSLFEELMDCLNERKEIGQIRLRECQYDGTLKGCSYTNFVTKELIEWQEVERSGNREIKYGNIHWVNNPSLVSKDALSVVTRRFKDEIECMEEFHENFPINAQLTPGLFEHIGPWRKRYDLIEKGYVCDKE